MLASRLIRRFNPRSQAGALAVAVLAALTISTFAPSPASAYSTQCSMPRCTLYLNRAESSAFANGPWMPYVGIAPIWAVMNATSGAMKWIARSWIARGYPCLAYRVTLVPWESQGMAGYRC
jgi:hypothetical protein